MAIDAKRAFNHKGGSKSMRNYSGRCADFSEEGTRRITLKHYVTQIGIATTSNVNAIYSSKDDVDIGDLLSNRLTRPTSGIGPEAAAAESPYAFAPN